MRVTQLDIQNLRIIRSAQLNTDASLVIICGGNASGKTSLLEALYSLLCGRSFRTRHGAQLINSDAPGYLVRAKLQPAATGSIHQIATELVHRQAPRFRQNAEDVRPSQLARQFPVQLIDASVFELIDGGPAHRRRFFDWGMFHVKHEFFPLWQKQRKICAHWNAMLRDGKAKELGNWKPVFVQTSEQLSHLRESHLQELSDRFAQDVDREAVQQLFGGEISISYRRGWPEGMGYAEFLTDSLERDLRDRRLKAGAHFFDLELRVDGDPVKEVLSRGQKKLLGLQLKLAQIKLYNALPEKDSCIVLVDDLAAEVDLENQKHAIREILAADSQVFFTAVDQSPLDAIIPEHIDTKMFHVEQGVLTEIN